MGRVYKAGVAGQLPWQDATRAVYVLRTIADLDQGHLLENRIAALERGAEDALTARITELEQLFAADARGNGHAARA